LKKFKSRISTTWNGKTNNFEGELFFESSGKKITAQYFFSGKPDKSLKKDDKINITFKIDNEEIIVKGENPKAFLSAPLKIQCMWLLAFETIRNNIADIKRGFTSVSKEMLRKRTVREIELALFGKN